MYFLGRELMMMDQCVYFLGLNIAKAPRLEGLSPGLKLNIWRRKKKPGSPGSLKKTTFRFTFLFISEIFLDILNVHGSLGS